MKKRLSGLACWWLVLVMLVGMMSTPAMALEGNTIYLYTGTDILEWDDSVDLSDMEERQIILDSPLDEQDLLSDDVMDNLIAWKLWEIDNGSVKSLDFITADGTLSQDDMSDNLLLEAIFATAVVAKNNKPLEYYYNGNVNNDKLIHVDLGTALNEQSAVMNELASPEGNVLNGWKLWRYTYCGGVRVERYEEEGNVISPKSVVRDYEVTKEDVMTIGDIFYEYFLVLEPQWMSKYKIDPQPTCDTPTVGVKEYDEVNGVWMDITDNPGLSYQWYGESIESYYLDDSHTELISENEAQYSSNGIWYLDMPYEDSWPVNLCLEQGVTIRVETVGSTEIDNIKLNEHSFENKGEGWELTLTEAVDTYLEVFYKEEPVENEDGVKIQITEKCFVNSVSGQNTKTLTVGESGTYACKVTLTNDEVLTSDAVEYTPPAHTHNYTYTASGAVITESCTCGHSEAATITAPENPIYDGTPKVATVTYSDSNNWQGGELAVAYSGGGNVNAGSVTASIEKDGETAGVTFEIAKATPVQNPEKLTKARVRRGQTLANATITNGEFFAVDNRTVLEGTFTWVDDTEIISNDTTKKMKFTPVDPNYAEIQFDVAVDSYTLGGGGSSVTRYTVKFDTDGGSSVASKNVTRNSKVAEPTAPTKKGFTFEGWYTDKEHTTAYDFDDAVKKNITLYAKWTEDKADDEQKGTDAHYCPSLAFADLDIAQWYHLDIDYVIENGIFEGTTETTFEPDSAQTRAMMVTVLYRAEGEPAVNRSIPFADVDMGAYYANAVIWAQQNGIIKGYSETEFGPEDKITREQIATIMHRYAQFKGYDVSRGENTNILSYDDFADISEYAIAAMRYAVGSGILRGKTESTLGPKDFATRAEVAAILHRFIEANK